MFRIRS